VTLEPTKNTGSSYEFKETTRKKKKHGERRKQESKKQRKKIGNKETKKE
jgi:hypothetical protein